MDSRLILKPPGSQWFMFNFVQYGTQLTKGSARVRVKFNIAL